MTFVVLGKAFGGILGDRYGLKKVGLIGLTFAAILLTYGRMDRPLSLLGILAFNITMPITLTLLANGFKKYKGFVFGLTTTALVTGFILDYYLKAYYSGYWIITLLFVGLSLIAFLIGSRMEERT